MMRLEWTVTDAIGVLTLCDPPSNTMSMACFRDLGDHVRAIRDDSRIKAVVVTGSGRHFSSGANLGELLNSIDEDRMFGNYLSLSGLGELPIPVIAAIQGVCLGSAFELALSCHFRISSKDAVIGLPETTFHLMPGLGGVHRLASLAGISTAIELILKGDTLPASRALELGLIDMVSDRKALHQTAIGFARFLAEKPFIRGYEKIYLHTFKKAANTWKHETTTS